MLFNFKKSQNLYKNANYFICVLKIVKTTFCLFVASDCDLEISRKAKLVFISLENLNFLP